MFQAMKGAKNWLLCGAVGLGLSVQAFAQERQALPVDYTSFLSSLRAEVAAKGLDVTVFDEAMTGFPEPLENVLKRLETQPESTFSFERYFNSMVSPTRIQNGRKKHAEYAPVFREMEQKYGVPSQVVAALWGVETAYGTYSGGFEIIPSLVTLSYASHRKDFFRKELFNALQILKEGHVAPHQMTGSWAGAMGQCQFMPSSFLSYAVDGNGDGKKDIWHTVPDVIASASNYLSQRGWKTGEAGHQRVILTKYLPKDLKMSDRGLTNWKTIEEWQKMGVIAAQGGFRLPADAKARLFLPEGPSKKAYLTYENFAVIMRWNNSSYFALSVLSLADEIAKKEAS